MQLSSNNDNSLKQKKSRQDSLDDLIGGSDKDLQESRYDDEEDQEDEDSIAIDNNLFTNEDQVQVMEPGSLRDRLKVV